VGSLSAPRSGDMLSPFPTLTASSEGSVRAAGRDGPGLSNPGGGQTSPWGGPL